MEDVCYSREAALEKAIRMEAQSFEIYKSTYFTARDRVARDLIRDLALDELRHKYTLEKAFFEEIILLHESGAKEGPSMKFSLLFEEKPLRPGSSEQEVMVHAIHEKKRSVDFYRNMAEQCGAAPMGDTFKRLAEDEEGHLARLEEWYEARYLKEM
jgi:rubrerythrin